MSNQSVSNLSILPSTTPVISLDQKVWSVVFTGFDKGTFPNRSITTYNQTLFEHNIRFVPLESVNNELCFFVLDPTNTVRATVYPTTDNPVEANDLINVIASLEGKVSPNILTNSFTRFNPTCPNPNKIVGEYVLGGTTNVDPYLLDFAIYAFALINPNGTFSVYSNRHLEDLANLKIFKPGLKVILAIGGWAADGFSDAALTPESRFAFAREAQKWVKEYNLDGIDLDWEYPGSSASGIKSRPQDTENFTLLIEALRIVLGKDAWISVAGIADSSYIRNVQIAKIAPFIDYFNVMAYDFSAGNTGDSGNRHQSNLYASDLGIGNISIELYVNNLVNAGMPKEKILIGLSFYGRRGATVTKSFDEIRANYLNVNGYTVRWDNTAKVPYITDPQGNFFLSFDNELSIYYKGQYVIDNCLGGLFSWQSNFDQANILASAMNLSVNNPAQLESILQNYYS